MPAIRRTKDQWKAIFDAQVSSGLKPPSYCEQNNIHLKTFYARRSDIATPRAPTKGKLVKVQKEKQKPTLFTADICLRYQGVEVNCHQSTNPSWVAALIKELAQ
tara:strand:- start:208 stop:519 length:312 start_codon:yes stop_codon:yes gene_type:complete